jgi:hypothetical protein
MTCRPMAYFSESSTGRVEMWELSPELSGRAYFRSDLIAQPHHSNTVLSESEAQARIALR